MVARTRGVIKWGVLLLFVVVGAAAVVLLRGRASSYSPPPMAYDGSSDGLKQTVIVPTLDTPMPEGKNIVRYESPEVFETLTKEWGNAKPRRRTRRPKAVEPAPEQAAV